MKLLLKSAIVLGSSLLLLAGCSASTPKLGDKSAADAGRCGALRFVLSQEGLGAGTDYFDANGVLVSTAAVADAPICRDDFTFHAGKRPSCEEHVLERDGGSPTS